MNLPINIFLLLMLLFSSELLLAQSATKNISWYQPHYVPPNEVKLSVIYEGTLNYKNTELKSYSISWQDTIGVKKGFSPQNRPYELKMIVRSADTIVGSYTGLSTQLRSCNFITNAKEVTIHFWLDKNQFYTKKVPRKLDSDSIKAKDKDFIAIEAINALEFSEMFKTRSEYDAIKINLNKTNQNIIDGYDHKTVILELNPNIVWLDYINKRALNPDPMPRMGPTYKNVMALNRYLLNRETGKIKKGKHWLLFNGVRKCCEIDFAIIDPQLEYKDKSGNTFSGKSLVKSKKIDLNSFHYNEFKSIYNCLPY
ncbi:MAG: hypothetical protein ISP69_07045 [Crocinitomicaceae bacterium]|nr:hypothetical protein [Crocinitomicaceae bacterium]